MHVPVGRSFQAMKYTSMRLPLSCGACGYHGEVEIVGVGTGAAMSPLSLDDQRAKAQAVEAAGDAAKQNARQLLRITPCPKCGARSAQGLQDFVIKQAVLVLLAPFAFVGVLWLGVAAQSSETPPAWIIPALSLPISLAVLVFHTRSVWKASKTRVTHVAPP
jgi:hypothetical protein